MHNVHTSSYQGMRLFRTTVQMGKEICKMHEKVFAFLRISVRSILQSEKQNLRKYKKKSPNNDFIDKELKCYPNSTQ